MATLRKNRTKKGYVYAVDFYFDGKRHVKSTKTSNYRPAKRILKEIECKIARNVFRLEEYKEKHIMMSDYLDEYFRYAGTYKEPSTIIREKAVVEQFRKVVGNMDIRDLNPEVLDIWKTRRLKVVRPVTFNIELSSMKAILNVAKRWGYLSRNPFTEIKKVKVVQRRLFMTEAELRRLFEALAQEVAEARRPETKEKLRLLGSYFEFLLYTGLRREEALNLEPEDVDYAQSVIYIRKAKDKESRVVPLTQQAKEILIAAGDGLFSSLSKTFVTHGFTTAARKAGLKGMKIHSLRHTFATRMIELGVDVLTVSKILGHSSVVTTAIYAKARLDGMRNALNVFENNPIPIRNLSAGANE